MSKLKISNPAHPEKIVAHYDETEASELDAIVDRAREAQLTWARVPQPERGRILGAFFDALEARTDEIAERITLEMGKLLRESKGEIGKGLAEARATISRAGAPLGEVLPSQTHGVGAYSTRRPRGVVLGINPWNFPFSTPIRKLAPALLYGNAIILKPASLCPGAVVLIEEVARDFLPQGLLTVVIGPGRMGQFLCEHPGIDAVSFTGSVEVGKKVAIAAVSHLSEVSLELGGKNPVILNDTSDIGSALDQITAAAMAVSGQRCTAISRVIVREEIFDSVIDGLTRRFSALKPGDGTDPNSGLAPLSSGQHLEDVAGFVDRARAAGATIEVGGTLVDTNSGGHYYPATLISGVTPDMEIARDEVFGPVVAVLRYKDIDEALQIANGVAFGLSSCLYSEQSPVIEAFVNCSESGMIHVNAGSFPENHMPFVGVKDSALGVGGSNGASTIQFYTTEHAVYRKDRA
ncbi:MULTISPECIES: aldehyde dehydrogenase [Sulfitobacter]|uniref:aldehyde dehydrogenase family protein n=1 Tax=Sulfitobacter TaxID=60136 RepID=UPI002307B286|nr:MULTISPECIES: aldehyde dehydrogenase family protein [Sulfitobacter]MDF3382649.1 aldehyde dehydrogenase [Sulfitobacter sp. Ks11]MDF3386068.1 aldehyde dehydrogenase [Sulfitobacter sp. M85]MDF3389487.1 aldehyde dehydrogenase [Sulfitobacter sp. Ks16]MDF3400124.1 aldehyde dehydrogenase [Sulfitobacter sp. KE39]MDF3403545.1 aldehyde dehydrogenase [Sulfitobacter sp. Ks35]